MDEAEYFDFIRKGTPDEESFQQEYMCVPSDDASAFIPWELLDGCTFREGEEWEYSLDQARACQNPIYGGLDIGRDHDLTSFTATEKIAGQRLVRKRIDLKAMAFSEQRDILYPWFEVCQRTAIDRNGIGRQFAEEATKRFGSHKIEEFNFTGPSKEELAYPVRSAFEDHSVLIPYEDDALKSDIRAIRGYIVTWSPNTISADATLIPPSFKAKAMSIARWRLLITVPGYDPGEARKLDFEKADAFFMSVAKGQIRPEPADDAVITGVPSEKPAGVEIVSGPGSRTGRERMDGI